MPGFVTSSIVPRPPETVFAYIVDLDNWPSFRGWGPLPGIVRAELADGTRQLVVGARVRVTNTDGSVHHEIVEELVPGRRYRVRMELGAPAAALMARIDEQVDLEATSQGTLVRRRFDVTARSWQTAPLAWLVAKLLLYRAVRAHDWSLADALGAGC